MVTGKKIGLLGHIMDGPVSLRAFFESLAVGIVVTDTENRIVFYNPAQADRDGLNRAEVIGRSIFDIYQTGDWPADFWADSGSALPRTWKGQHQSRNGRFGQVSVVLTPLLKGGQVIGSIYAFEDVSSARPGPARELAGRSLKAGGGAAFARIVGRSAKMLKAIELGRSAALSPSPVLISGETGTGKELFARSLHDHSPRAGRDFVPINCAAIPPELLEGMLFGTTRGAFTGAADKPGLFEQADQGTLFLDELDSMPLKLQPKLLRVLQDRKIRRVGSARELELNVKLISAISGSPNEAIKQGRLRPDLFYRLGVVIIKLPPLRERPDDLALLAEHFIKKHNAILGRRVQCLAPEVIEAFTAYDWPGNARELEHIIEAILNVAETERVITLEMLPDHFSLSPQMPLSGYGRETFQEHGGLYLSESDGIGSGFDLPTLKDKEKEMISKALFVAEGNVAQAARILKISRQLLVYKMKKHHLSRRNFTK